MSQSRPKKSWLRLPRWGALVLGLGALFASDATEAKSELGPLETAPGSWKKSGSGLGDVAIRAEEEKIYISRHGGAFEELPLGDTQDAAHLRELLDRAGAAQGPISVPTGSFIVANGGATGNGAKPKQPTAKKSGPKQPSGNESGNGR